VAERCTYHGSPYHKDRPGYAGLPKANARRPAGSICPTELADDRNTPTQWLREAIIAGRTGRWDEQSGLPKEVFHRVGGVVDDRSPRCALRPARETTRRFAIARAIGHHVLRDAPRPCLLTRTNTDEQAATRAFAAELLAPASSLRDRLGDRVGQRIDDEEVQELADVFDVSEWLIEHQIRNHDLGYPDDSTQM